MLTGNYLVEGSCPVCPWKGNALGCYKYENPEHKDNPTEGQIEEARKDAETKLQDAHNTAMACLACDCLIKVRT